MKNSLIALTFVLPLAVGCGGSSTKKSTDMAVKGGNDGGTGGNDMTAGGSCTTGASWPTAHQAAFKDGTGYAQVADGEPNASDSSLTDILSYEWYGMGELTAHTHTIGSDETYGTCSDCVQLYLGSDFSSGNPGDIYFATGGSINVSQADSTVPSGTITVSATNLHLVHWDYADQGATDEADADGKCYDIAAFNATGMYTIQSDDGGSN